MIREWLALPGFPLDRFRLDKLSVLPRASRIICERACREYTAPLP
jgi:hypothetical protein